ncbi:peptidase M8 [Cavenderia fasciculata]|uniref:Peptidase M8 n=1 Tax=Cavenderia fasciculata TaxID=261658 RepID=F4PJU5_CACFS|nr:peptidase M8 [Cavenderia fasciculata]EGG23869.1 peptidase M8 [Cavenderia fasciculata]|eukprot:XP_004361720.1 peptidase M8 [Cavenderia fasciculata]
MKYRFKLLFIFLFLVFFLFHFTFATSNQKEQSTTTTKSNNDIISNNKPSQSKLSINDIINKGYDDWSKSKHTHQKVTSNKFVESSSSSSLDQGSIGGYKCQHDVVSKDIDGKIKEGLKHLKEEDLPPPPPPSSSSSSSSESSSSSSSSSLPKGFLKASKMVNNEEDVVESTRQPIRITFESIIEADTFKCTTVGQQVPTGLATASKSCSTATANDASCMYTCTSNDLVTNQVIENINVVMANMRELFANLLMVDQVNPLKLNSFVWSQLNQECDYGIPINSSMIADGIQNTDIIVYVTSRPTTSTSTIAYAKACNFNVFTLNRKQIYGRPLAATINFNPIYFNASPSRLTFKEYVRVGIHEMTHALGFSNMFYSSYQNQNGLYQNPLIGLTQTGKTPKGVSYEIDRFAINSTSVLEFAQDHFECNQAFGVQLEDSGGSGTSYSHWEKRQIGEEYMLGYVAPIMPITGLTLSLLQDTGWYDVAMDKAEPLLFGKKMGCDFMTQCTPDSWNYQGYFCNNPGKRGCTPTRMGKGVCTIFQYQNDLPAAYQHFTDTKFGGEYAADACPLYQVPDNYQLGVQYCVDVSQTGNSDVHEVFSDNSRCFEYSDNGDVKQACWEFKCQGTQVSVNVNGVWNLCPDATNITVSGINILCPHGFVECGATPTKVEIDSLSSSCNTLLPQKFNIFGFIFLLFIVFLSSNFIK